MKPKVIKTEEEYKLAIKFLEELGDIPNFEDNAEMISEFELISLLVATYENETFAIGDGDPIEIIQLKMEYMGLERKDLIPYIGSKEMISEVFNKKRGLSKSMIRNLANFLKIDQKILNVDYPIHTAPAKIRGSRNNELRSPFKNINKKIQGQVENFAERARRNGSIIQCN
jgi:HTH-type transcriptional regulator/antitoxin HigA